MAIAFILMGGFAVAIRGQQSRVRGERVRKGELSPELAAKRDRFMSWAGYAMIALALVILVLHYAGQ